ncbi:MAG TPA: bis-aminopropyl spermidine synthase family protein [Longimicrobium sp.]|nr:bis-aminopropyl spermidine synthase family protein [Longimicrobium sp.]
MAYADYLELLPLQLHPGDAERGRCWRRTEQLTERGFSRLIAALAGAAHLDDLSARCDLDFDNLAPVLCVLIGRGLLAISSDGALRWNLPPSPARAAPPAGLYEHPAASWNQFPCDPESREARVRLIARDHPFGNFARIGIVGDDDLLSPALAATGHLQPVVLEGDPEVRHHLQRLSISQELAIETHPLDVRDLDADIQAVPLVDSFITDPPYSYDGVLTFVYQGLRLLRRTDDNRFYLVLNTMMLGRDLHRVQHALAVSGAALLDVKQAANRYPFPEGYGEAQRMRAFLDRRGGGARTAFSSSSSTFVWSAPDPDLDRLRTLFDPSQIYRR